MPEPFAVVSVQEMLALEAAAVAAGTSERVLQERAGLGVADVIEAELGLGTFPLGPRPSWPLRLPGAARLVPSAGSGQALERSEGMAALPGGWPRSQARVLVLAGPGNNGRDGVVAGRRLAARGCRVEVWHGARNPMSEGETRDLVADGVPVRRYDLDGAVGPDGALRAACEGADVIVDALLGVGSRGALRPEMAAVAEVVNGLPRHSGPLVVAVDMPTGIDADSGDVAGVALTADITVTFGAVKAGLLRFPAANHVGRLVPWPIGLPAGSMAKHPVHILDEHNVQNLIPLRPMDSHKYRLGRVLVVAGSDQFVGAACLGSAAAARAGAGLVGVVSTEAVKHVLATQVPEATFPLTIPDLHEHPEQSAEQVAALLPEQAILLIGPGIGRSDATERFLRRLLSLNGARNRPTSAVIDADALSLLANWPDWWEQIGRGHVLTPHAGEMARLLASDPALEQIDGEAPWETARRASTRWHQAIVLKGPFTTVAEIFGRAWVYPHANAALATAGTGDVLAGLTAGLAAQGVAPVAAARLAVVVHALAGRRAADGRGRRTVVASDLPPELPGILADLASSPDTGWR